MFSIARTATRVARSQPVRSWSRFASSISDTPAEGDLEEGEVDPIKQVSERILTGILGVYGLRVEKFVAHATYVSPKLREFVNSNPPKYT
jgi:hypothetical protein